MSLRNFEINNEIYLPKIWAIKWKEEKALFKNDLGWTEKYPISVTRSFTRIDQAEIFGSLYKLRKYFKVLNPCNKKSSDAI